MIGLKGYADLDVGCWWSTCGFDQVDNHLGKFLGARFLEKVTSIQDRMMLN
ncbi:unnamed protein product [Acidithrix sp. C25]|nr:unnamed protein product [Acidithrix sp. C25]